jgi:hypothetical protein
MRSKNRLGDHLDAHRNYSGIFGFLRTNEGAPPTSANARQSRATMDKTSPILGSAVFAVIVGVCGCGQAASQPAPQTPPPAPAPQASGPASAPEQAEEASPNVVVAAAAQPMSPGKEQTMRTVCNAGLVDVERAQCAGIVTRANNIDPLAADVCASIVAPQDRIGCVQAIANRYYTIAEARACTRAVVAADRLACLRAAGSTRAPTGRDDGRVAASEVCASMREVGERQRCIESVAPAKSFAKEAVRVCAGLLASQDQIACLGKVRDRTYTRNALASCNAKKTVAERIDCLGGTGRAGELARAMK